MENEERNIRAVNELLMSNVNKTRKSDSLLKIGDTIRCIGSDPKEKSYYSDHLGETFTVKDSVKNNKYFCFADPDTGKVVTPFISWHYTYFELVTES